MTVYFKKWLYNKAYGHTDLKSCAWSVFKPSLELYIKAMWVVNRERKISIEIQSFKVEVCKDSKYIAFWYFKD